MHMGGYGLHVHLCRQRYMGVYVYTCLFHLWICLWQKHFYEGVCWPVLSQCFFAVGPGGWGTMPGLPSCRLVLGSLVMICDCSPTESFKGPQRAKEKKKKSQHRKQRKKQY